MTAFDIILIAALIVFVVAWWARGLPRRGPVLLAAAVVALAAGLASVLDDRWQAGVGAAVGVLFLLALGIGRLRKGARRGGVPWISGPLLTLLAVPAVLALYLFPALDLPAPSGPHLVGVRSFELDDPARTGVLLAGKDEPRRLLVRVWYPAQDVAGRERRPYFTQAEADGMARGIGDLFGFPPFLKYAKHALTHSHEDAPLLAGTRDLPTAFYSHGFHSFLSQNTVLMEELASHGYVIYSVQHTYDASGTVFPDGSVAPIDPALIEQATQSPEARGELPEAMVKGYTGTDLGERLQGQLQNAEEKVAARDRIITVSGPIWLADRLFVHDRLQRGEVPAEVAGIVAASALDRVGEMGMSFGGSTSGAVCMVDPRCAAGVNLDGGDFHLLAVAADLPRPLLMFHSDFGRLYGHFGGEATGAERSFNDFSYERFEHAGARDDIYRLQLKDTEHLGLSDLAWFMRRPLRDGLLGSAPVEVMLGAQNDFVRGFLDKHLRGIASDFPQAEYAKYQGRVLRYDNAPLRAWWLSQPAGARAQIERRIEALKAGVPVPQRPHAAADAPPAIGDGL